MTEQKDFLAIREYSDEVQARQAVAYLEAGDIKAVLLGANHRAVDPAIAAAISLRITVSKEDAEEASIILDAFDEDRRIDHREHTFLIVHEPTLFWAIILFFPIMGLMVRLFPFFDNVVTALIVGWLCFLPGYYLGKARIKYLCSEYTCHAANPQFAQHCINCGREIKGVLKSRDEMLEKEEALGL